LHYFKKEEDVLKEIAQNAEILVQILDKVIEREVRIADQVSFQKVIS
jgi:hypothetical protein